MKRVLIIQGKRKTLQKAKSFGLEVIHIQKTGSANEALRPYADYTFAVDIDNREDLLSLVRTIYEKVPFQYATSLTEAGLLPVAQVNDAFSLPGNSLETVTLLKEKWAMRQHLNALGISPVASRSGQTEEDIRAFADDFGLPMIIKPTNSSGSYGISCMRERADITSIWKQIQARGMTPYLMEEYLEGQEVSVETFSFAGRHIVIAITDKVVSPNFVELGHSVPAQVDESIRHDIVHAVVSFLDAVGLKEGPGHTEVKLTSKGPRIVESHNRVGGDKISQLVQIAYGVDMVLLALAWPFGYTEALSTSPSAQAGAAIRFFAPPPGRVRKISGIEEVRNHQAVVELELTIGEGSLVLPVQRSADRSGHLLVRGLDAQKAIVTCEQWARRIQIETE